MRKPYGRKLAHGSAGAPDPSDGCARGEGLLDRRWISAVRARFASDASLILVGLMTLMFLMLFSRGVQLGLDHGSSGRVSIHAVPVAIATLYHGLPHDYTSRKAFALAFQDADMTFQEKVDAALKASVDEESEKYYWAADDRGMADFVIGAFKLFGPKERSLYRFYFVVLLISLVAYAVAYYRNTAALALAVFALAGVAAFQSILPLVDEATFLAMANADKRMAPVGMFEPRALDVLTMLAVLHLSLYAWRTPKPGILNVVMLVVQVLVFVFVYHARSSLGWQVVAILLLSVLVLGYRSWAGGKQRLRQITVALLPVLFLAAGLAALQVYKRQAYDPLYFAEAGSRTFWHNALMGLGSSRHLGEKYGLGVDDRMIVEAVVKHAKGRMGDRLGPEWEAQKILESLGGHGIFDWKTYEIEARSLYFEIISANKRRAAVTYLIRKPLESLSVVLRSMREHRDPKIAQVQNAKGLFFNPYAWPFAGAALAALLLAFGELRRSRDIWLMIGVIAVASLIPSIAFYSATLTLGGFFVTISIAAYLALCSAADFLGHRYLRPA
jgi:hypothetical protein